MLPLAPLVFLVVGQPVREYIPPELYSYRVETPGRSYIHPEQGHRVVVTSGPTVPEGDAADWRRHNIPLRDAFLDPLPSGIPAGGYSAMDRSSWKVGVVAVSPYEYIGVNVYYRPKVVLDRVEERAALCERIARVALARLAARRAFGGEDVVVAGKPLKAFFTTKTRAAMVPLEAWAAAKGVALNLNRDNGTAAFSVGGVPCLVALASPKIKVGSEWKTMPDMAMDKGGTWIVPVKSLP